MIFMVDVNKELTIMRFTLQVGNEANFGVNESTPLQGAIHML